MGRGAREVALGAALSTPSRARCSAPRTEWLRAFLRDQETDPWALPGYACAMSALRSATSRDGGISSSAARWRTSRGCAVTAILRCATRIGSSSAPGAIEPGATAPGTGAVSYGTAERLAYHDLIADWYDFALKERRPPRAWATLPSRRSCSTRTAGGVRRLAAAARRAARASSSTAPAPRTASRGDGRLTPREPVTARAQQLPLRPARPGHEHQRLVDARGRPLACSTTGATCSSTRPSRSSTTSCWSATCAACSGRRRTRVETDFTAKLVEVRPGRPPVALCRAASCERASCTAMTDVVRLEPGASVTS